MASREELLTALRNADAAGDEEGARRIAAMIQSGGSQPQRKLMDNPILSTVKNTIGGAVRGAGSIGATLLAPVDAAARAVGIQNDFIGRTDRREAMDGGLQSAGFNTESIPFAAGKIGAEVAGTLGVGGALAGGLRTLGAVAPRANAALSPLNNAISSGGMVLGQSAPTNALAQLGIRSAGGAVTGGAATSLVDPNSAGTGAAIGAALPPVAKAAGALGGAIGRSIGVNPRAAEVGRLAQSYDIPVSPGDVAQPTTKAIRSVLNDLPLVGGIGASQRESQQAAFNRAVGNTFGSAEESLSPQVMDAARSRLGGEFDRLWNGNSVSADATFAAELQALRNRADKLPSQAAGSLRAEIDDLLSKVQPNGNGPGSIPGDTANAYQSYLRRRAEGSSELRNELGDLRQTIIGGFNRSVRPEDAAALTQARSQYKAFKTVEPLLDGAELGVAGRTPGDVPAGMLPNAVRKSYIDPTGTELGDLSLIGSQLLADRVARTGGSTRAAVQNGLLGAAAFSNPGLAAVGYAGAGGLNALLNSPRLGAMLLQPNQNQLLSLIRSESPELLGRAAPVLLSNP